MAESLIFCERPSEVRRGMEKQEYPEASLTPKWFGNHLRYLLRPRNLGARTDPTRSPSDLSDRFDVDGYQLPTEKTVCEGKDFQNSCSSPNKKKHPSRASFRGTEPSLGREIADFVLAVIIQS